MHGTRAANYAMDEADLIVAIGARFDDRITGKLSEFAPRAKFIHIDIDPAEISKNVPAHIPIVGDAKNILAAAASTSTARSSADPARLAGLVGADRAAGARSTRCATTTRADTEIKPQYLVEALYEATGGDVHRRLRRRPAPDVGGAVLPLRQAAPLDQLRRPGDDGLRPAGRDGRRGRAARTCRPCVHHRRRLVPDEHPGARDLRASTRSRSRS